MSTTPPDTSSSPGPESAPPLGDSGPSATWDDIRDLGRLRRTRADRRIAGVAGGLGRHLDIDPLILRVAFVVLTFFGGAGLLLYIACWLIVPEEGSEWGRIALDRRSRTVALVLVGLIALFLLFGHWWWSSGVPWVILLIAVVVAVVALRRPRHEVAPGQPGASLGQGPAQDPAGTAPPAGQTAAYPASAPVPPRPVNPRKKGPILFWFALAVMAVALGGLGIADLAGADVTPSAYPATALGLAAAFLLLGSFFGRAGGLILVGLVAAAVTVGSTIADRWDPHTATYLPTTASQVRPSYDMDVGEIVLDLTDISDPKALNGREITVTGNVGHLDIRVPSDVTVVANTHVTGIGGINAFGRDGGGVDTELSAFHYAGPDAPRLTIDADLHVGGIDVHTGPRS